MCCLFSPKLSCPQVLLPAKSHSICNILKFVTQAPAPTDLWKPSAFV